MVQIISIGIFYYKMARPSRQKNYCQYHPKFQILAFGVGYGPEGYRYQSEIGP